MSGADGLGWAGAVSAQRAGQVVSTTQTPGPSKTRQAKAVNTSQRHQACVSVYVQYGLPESQQTHTYSVASDIMWNGAASTCDPHHMLAVNCWTEDVKLNREEKKQGIREFCVCNFVKEKMFISSSSSSFCTVNRLMTLQIYWQSLRGTRLQSCKLCYIFFYIRVFISSCNNTELHSTCVAYLFLCLCVSEWDLNRPSVYMSQPNFPL